MAVKQKTDDSDNLRQAIGRFRDAIEAISSPLPSGLETMLRMERLTEALDAGLPLVGFGPFDGLTSGAEIDGGRTPTTGNLRKHHPDMDSERYKPPESRGESPCLKGGAPVWGIENHSRGNINGVLDTAQLIPGGQEILVPDTTPEMQTEVNTQPLKQKQKQKQKTGGGGVKTIPPIKVPAMASCPDTSGPGQARGQKPGLVENTLAVVDKLAEEILDDDAQQTHAERGNGDSGLNGPGKNIKMKALSNFSTDMLRAIPEKKASGHTGRGNPRQKKNSRTGGQDGVADGAPPGALAFTTIQNGGHNANPRHGCRPLADCLAKVGILADEILRSSATGSKTHVNARAQSRAGFGGNDRTARAADTVSGVGEFDRGPDMKFQQPKGEFFSRKTGSVTEAVFSDSMPANSLDKDAVTSLVNDVLVEQARRHGVDLS